MDKKIPIPFLFFGLGCAAFLTIFLMEIIPGADQHGSMVVVLIAIVGFVFSPLFFLIGFLTTLPHKAKPRGPGFVLNLLGFLAHGIFWLYGAFVL